ncbi:Spy/CpxP family protein refolding chaperone [Thermophagus sp. OGC60D27]|uniref:Spy/CpxP family protein refolding chaperone n=1 Tax=Thermophagus sp. OGC60D27 TaxID=3458415 RepID=UPI0040381D6B
MKNKEKYILVAVIVLIVLNIFSWGLLWHSDSPQKKEVSTPRNEASFSRTGNFLTRKLGFNDLQVQEFQKMQKKHFAQLRKYEQQYKLLRDDYVTLAVSTDFDTHKADSIFYEMGQINSKIQKANWLHFRSIYQLCDEHQKQEFRQLILKLNKRNKRDRRNSSFPSTH